MSDLLTIRQAAEFAAVSFPTARRWIDKDLLAVVRVGKVVRIRKQDLESFLEAHLSKQDSHALSGKAQS